MRHAARSFAVAEADGRFEPIAVAHFQSARCHPRRASSGVRHRTGFSSTVRFWCKEPPSARLLLQRSLMSNYWQCCTRTRNMMKMSQAG
ncbi:hypothetical protein VZT92_026756 [Zoarces viviparus]|uniref:Uncharacterized protein n=1 Tax=Zoarces viviparus TaxID=48416 RepID=A0AAW1DSB2_ZOAVI